MSTRLCLIESASVVDSNDAGDGAYDLHDQTGTPDEIGKAIADSLKTTDLFQGRALSSRLAAGDDLFLILRIKFCDPDATPPGSLRPKRYSTPADPLGDVFFQVEGNEKYLPGGTETFRSVGKTLNMIDQNKPKDTRSFTTVLSAAAHRQGWNQATTGDLLLRFLEDERQAGRVPDPASLEDFLNGIITLENEES